MAVPSVLIVWDGKEGRDKSRLEAAMRDLGYASKTPFTWHLIQYALRDMERKGMIRPFHDASQTRLSESREVRA